MECIFPAIIISAVTKTYSRYIYIFYLFRLRNISENAFELSSHIKMLNLADNLLEHIDQAAFEPLKRLKGKKDVLNKYDMNILLKICSVF